MYQTQKEWDEALNEKNLELYEIKIQLEEEKGKNQKLAVRINRDYMNSSKSSSQSPNLEKFIMGGKKQLKALQPHHQRKNYELARTVEIHTLEELV